MTYPLSILYNYSTILIILSGAEKTLTQKKTISLIQSPTSHARRERTSQGPSEYTSRAAFDRHGPRVASKLSERTIGQKSCRDPSGSDLQCWSCEHKNRSHQWLLAASGRIPQWWWPRPHCKCWVVASEAPVLDLPAPPEHDCSGYQAEEALKTWNDSSKPCFSRDF